MSTLDMFSETGIKPKRPRKVMMHVADAGNGPSGSIIRFECARCGHRTEWMEDDKSVSENKRGVPCSACNQQPIGELEND